MSDLPIRVATAADWPGIREVLYEAYHQATFDEEAERLRWRGVLEPQRSLVATDAAKIVGHAGLFTRELTVPGALLPAAHVTMVAVAPTYTRRGLLTRMMRQQLAELAVEPVALLWASEGRIYPRFGYGMAAERFSLAVESREVRLPEPATPGRVRTVPAEAARPELEQVYEAVRPGQPGWSSRDARWWDRILADPPNSRGGTTPRRVTLCDSGAGDSSAGDNRAGDPDGYVLWRVKEDWTSTGPASEVVVDELVAATPEAHLRLWRFLLGIDLTRRVRRRLSGPGEPLLQLADEPRSLGVARVDGLYLRIVDLPAALAARRYAAPVDVVLEVTDALRPGNAGRWRLTGDPTRATCTPTTDPPDLACDIADVGAVYLGGTRLADLAAAGRVRELRPETLAAASTGLGWHRPPAGLEVF